MEENIKKLKAILEKAERGEIYIEHFNIHAGIVEIAPENNTRRFEKTGAETLTIIYRTPKQWDVSNK